MLLVGVLEESNGISKLGGDRLARCSAAGDPLTACTQFLREVCGLTPGDTIEVEGSLGMVGGVPVVCVTSASKSSARSLARAFKALRPIGEAVAARRNRNRG